MIGIAKMFSVLDDYRTKINEIDEKSTKNVQQCGY